MKGFRTDENGNYTIIFAITLVPVMSAVAGVTDFASITNKTDQLQNALDTAAIAVAGNYLPTMAEGDVNDIALTFLGSNTLDLDRIASDEQVEVTMGADRYFVTVRSSIIHDGMIGSAQWRAHRASTAQILPGPDACVLALDAHASQAVKIQGSATVDMNGCILAANSNSQSAIYRGGSAKLIAECTTSVGETNGLDASSSVSLACGGPKERQYPSFDPLAAVQPPAYTACQNVPGGKTKTLSPGTFCGKTFSGNITLNPGTYILRGGKVNLGGNGALRGEGVTIFLMEGAQFSINGNEIVDLSPPQSGDYAGITVFRDRSSDLPVTINGTSASRFSGFVYAPGAHVSYSGTGTTDSEGTCVRLVGKTIELNGNASFKSACESELGDKTIYASRSISIIR